MSIGLDIVLLITLLLFIAVGAAVHFTIKKEISRNDKAIFDERQSVIKSRLAIEVLLVCISAVGVNGWIMSYAYQWAESNFAAIVMIAVLCFTYWVIRRAAEGCAAAAVNIKAQKQGIVTAICCAVVQLPMYLSGIGEADYVVKDGRLSDKFMFSASFTILIACGILMLCVMRHEEKRNESGVSK
ncbi:MAG: hypothetical protein K2N38_11935 [Oscillospiraceae bacterium]|nr:hypothetical protein [Oscillospiraceae bacterium]